MEGHLLGVLDRTSDGRLSFAYDVGVLDQPSTPLSTAFPIGEAVYRGRALDAWLAGLLPDNGQVIDRWSRTFHTGTSPFSLLSTAIGLDCAGAVQFVPEEGLEQVLARHGGVEWLDDDEVGRRIGELKRDSASWLGATMSGQFSLAGAQAKTALVRRENRWGVPHGSEPTTHILKPSIPGFDQHDVNEHLCLLAARHLGLPAARTSVTEIGGESVLVVERYDRLDVEGTIRRIHQEDLCQALGVPPGRKYESDGGPSAKDITTHLAAVLGGELAQAAIRRFVDALALNWLIAGTDAHAKNYSLLLSGHSIRLAPLYDIASILPIDDTGGRELRTAMKIGGDYRLPSQGRRPWDRLAVASDLPSAMVVDRVAELAERVPSAFAAAIDNSNLSIDQQAFAERLVAAIARRCEACLGRLAINDG